MKQKWYLQTWLICVLFALWFLYGIPLIIGIVLLVLKTKEDKKLAETITQLETDNQHFAQIMTPEMQDSVSLQKHIEDLASKETELNDRIKNLEEKARNADLELAEKRKQLICVDEEISVQEFGLYTPQYDFANALDYKEELVKIRAAQKALVKDKKAANGAADWTVNGSKKEGKKMVSDITKLLLRAFNVECDEVVAGVKYTNFDSSLNRIYKSAETISKLGTTMHISITKEYLELKVKELRLAFEYRQKQQEEKEAAKAAREEQREQAKVQKELEEQQKKIEKEQTHYQTAYEKVLSQLQQSPDDPDLLSKKAELEVKLQDIDKALADIDYRQANMKAGYVYIISNIGSFGKDVYKIGMTRRLDPQERVDELGDASVPFRFDVHAMIFSDDAPALEASLHRAFEDRKVNMVNQRREFFHVTLDEIKEVVRNNYDKTVEFIDVPDAEQYRISQKMHGAA